MAENATIDHSHNYIIMVIIIIKPVIDVIYYINIHIQF